MTFPLLSTTSFTLEEERETKQEKEFVAFYQNPKFHLKNTKTKRLLYLAADASDLCHVIVHVESDVLL